MDRTTAQFLSAERHVTSVGFPTLLFSFPTYISNAVPHMFIRSLQFSFPIDHKSFRDYVCRTRILAARPIEISSLLLRTRLFIYFAQCSAVVDMNPEWDYHELWRNCLFFFFRTRFTSSTKDPAVPTHPPRTPTVFNDSPSRYRNEQRVIIIIR